MKVAIYKHKYLHFLRCYVVESTDIVIISKHSLKEKIQILQKIYDLKNSEYGFSEYGFNVPDYQKFKGDYITTVDLLKEYPEEFL